MSVTPQPQPGADPHQVLGVSPDASQAEITRAYRRLLRQHHPDTAPGHTDLDQRRLDQVLAAYQHLRSTRHARPAAPSTGVPVTIRYHPGDQNNPTPRRHTADAIWLDRPTGRPDAGSSRRSIPITYPGADTAAAVTITPAQARAGAIVTVAAPGNPAQGLRNIRVRIPPGTRNGQTLRLPGHGAPGNAGGQGGDLHLTVYHVTPSS